MGMLEQCRTEAEAEEEVLGVAPGTELKLDLVTETDQKRWIRPSHYPTDHNLRPDLETGPKPRRRWRSNPKPSRLPARAREEPGRSRTRTRALVLTTAEKTWPTKSEEEG